MARSKKKSISLNASFFLQLTLAGFFIVLGIKGILQNVDEGIFGLRGVSQPIEILFGVLELVCGIILIAGLFIYTRRKTLALASLLIVIFWAIRIVLTFIVNGFYPQALDWWLYLFVELIVLLAALAIRDRYSV